jgi:hypothetical protein
MLYKRILNQGRQAMDLRLHRFIYTTKIAIETLLCFLNSLELHLPFILEHPVFL